MTSTAKYEAPNPHSVGESHETDAIAVVGVGCRFPGGAHDPVSFWQRLMDGAISTRDVPRSRWDADAFFDADPSTPGKIVSRKAHLLDDIAGFDAEFFGISPREARQIDPQQRLLLEVTWEALQAAGIAPRTLAGSRTGVFAGVMSSCEYAKLQAPLEYDSVDAYHLTGNELSFAAGRISYLLSASGPCMTLDTACSSSLVAVHQACQSLRLRECDVALAGGVSLILTPEWSVGLSKSRVLSVSGVCRPFDAEADGFVRGEGAAMIVLQRLSDALTARAEILCVIRGSSVQHAGATGGLTVPSRSAQEGLMRAALAQARLEPEQVGYHEAHGTGTALGDLIELHSLAAVFGDSTRKDARALQLGSLKANFGHMDAAAGVAGLLKCALVLKHGIVPPHPTLRTPHPELSANRTLHVPTCATPLGDATERRIAGVSAFGLSGIGAYVVLEAAPASSAQPASAPDRTELIAVSARSSAALAAQAERYAQQLSQLAPSQLSTFAAAAIRGRDHYEYRYAVTASTPAEAADRLRAAATQPAQSVDQAACSTGVAFVFPGHGSQWLGMGQTLMRDEPAFRAVVEHVSRAAGPHVNGSVADVLRDGTDATVEDGIFLQLTLFAVQLGLVALWRSFGVEPAVVLGHSLGEVTAACVAGCLSVEEAVLLIRQRAQAIQRFGRRGGMAVVRRSAAALEATLASSRGAVVVAGYNDPNTTLISGELAALEAVLGQLSAEDCDSRRVAVSFASHSPCMDPALEPLRAALSGLAPRDGELPIFSGVTGQLVPGDRLNADYWVEHLRQPVQFETMVRNLLAEGYESVLEVSAHPTLLPHLAATASGADQTPLLLPSLRRNQPARTTLLESLAALYTCLPALDLLGSYPEACARRQPLPSYPWQRQPYWSSSAARRAPGLDAASHVLLGQRFRTSVDCGHDFWQSQLAAATPAYFADHALQGNTVMSGAACLEAMFAAVHTARPLGNWALDDIRFESALVFNHTEPRVVQTVVRSGQDPTRLQVASRNATDVGASFEVHCSAALRTGPETDSALPCRLEAIRERCPEQRDAAAFYSERRAQGMEYGPAFRGIQRLHVGEREVLAELALLPELAAQAAQYLCHPALLDAAMHASMAVLPRTGAQPTAVVPTAISGLQLWQRAPAQLLSHVRLREGHEGDTTWSVDIDLVTHDGVRVAALEGLQLQALPTAAISTQSNFELAWTPTPLPAATTETHGAWLLMGDAAMSGDLGAALERRGQTVSQLGADNLTGIREYLAADSARGVVLLCPPSTSTSTSSAEVPELAARHFEQALQVAQTLAQYAATPSPRLWFVTQHAHAPRRDHELAAATLLGVARTLAYEHPELRSTCVDLTGPFCARLDVLVDELIADSRATEVALGEHGRSISELKREPAQQHPPATACVRSDATYLITGGLGGLGLAAAHWLASSGARHLVLMGRSGATQPEQRRSVAALEAAGVNVRIAPLDVADREQVRALLETVRLELPPLRGIIHTAGVLRDARFIEQTPDAFAAVSAPKALGAWHLHTLTRDLPLDFFILYSSVSAMLGSPGQANYAAANTFLDALARYRRSLQLPALSVQWGPFSQVGMAAHDGERMAQRGMRHMLPSTSGTTLAGLLNSHASVVGIADFDAQCWLQAHPQLAGSNLLARLVDDRSTSQTLDEPAAVSPAELLALTPRQRQARLHDFVHTQIATVLRVPRERVTAHSLKRMGIDSLMGMELKTRICTRLAVTIPLLTFLRDATPAELFDEVAQSWFQTHASNALGPDGLQLAEEGWEISQL